MIDLSKVMLCEVGGQRIRYSQSPVITMWREASEPRKVRLIHLLLIHFSKKKIPLPILEEAQGNQLVIS